MGRQLHLAADDQPPETVTADPDAPLELVTVAVERSLDAGHDTRLPDGGLTYLGGDLPVGARVEVPLGRGDRPALGYVLAAGGRELLGGLDPAKLKRVRRAAGPVLPPALVELGVWLAGYYVTPVGMVLGSMVPGAAKKGTGRKDVMLIDREPAAARPAPPPKLTPTAAATLAVIDDLPADVFPCEPKRLAQLAGAANLGPLNRLVDAGLLRRVTRGRIDPRGELFDAARWADRRPPPQPTPEQTTAVDAIWPPAADPAPAFAVHLLHGVTASGKTEVYLRLIERCLAVGRAAIVMVPEIALTPQTAGRFVGRFPDHHIAVLHSGLSASARHAAWDLLLRGEARVAVGPRSAVFAPLTNLGLIVVDEEHEPSYKQESLPRYHARDVAIKRAQLAGCPVVLGSATPSLESFAAAEVGRYRLHRLARRVAGASLPEVRIVDISDERALARGTPEAAHADLIGPTLLAALGQTLDDGAQAVLLLNRRGYAGHLACPDAACGWVMACRHCDATMVLHRAHQRPGQHAPAGFLRCHHCAAEQVRPKACPTCGKGLILLGAGTQKAEETIASLLAERFGLDPARDLARLDADAARATRTLHATLDRFAAGRLRVLLGTQMIAKGLDVPGVRLVGVLSADTALAIPDFRAAERTFQLVSQVAGRAGRGAAPGLVIVQTIDPGQPAVRFAADHDYDQFARLELALRHDAAFPPAVRMARVVCRDRREDRAADAAQRIADALRGAGEPIRVDGPWPCPIARIADHFRHAVEITSRRAHPIQRAMETLRRRGLLKSDAKTAVDVDPVNLL